MEKFTENYKSTWYKNRYFIPILSMILYLSIAVGITVTMKYLTGTSKREISIATNTAEETFYNRKYDAAIVEYTKLQEKEEWPIWNMKIAEIYSIKGEFVKSNKIIQKVYETRNRIIDQKKEDEKVTQTKDIELINYIVFTSLMNGENKKALEYGELFLQEQPNDKNLLRTMFTVYMANDNKDKAKNVVKSYLRNGATASDLADLASMDMLVGDFDEGLSILKDAWNKDKNEVKVFDVIVQIADYDKNYVLDKLSKLEKKETNELAYKIWKAKIYSMNKEFVHEAEELVNDLDNKDVGNINLMLIKANMYQSQGETEKAKEVLKGISNEDSESFIGYYADALQAYNDEKYSEAFKSTVKSIIIDREYANNYGVMIPEIMAKQNRGEDSEPYFRTALYKEPFNYGIIINFADYYVNTLKDTNKALYYYDLASKLRPNDSEIYYNMAQIKVNNQREDEAVQFLKKSISLNSKIAKYHRALGAVYLNKGKNEEAIQEIRSAYVIDKSDILTLNNAGCYYISVEGDLERGLINLKAAYDGINEKTSEKDKDTITENYNRVKNLLNNDNKKNKSTLKVADLKIIY